MVILLFIFSFLSEQIYADDPSEQSIIKTGAEIGYPPFSMVDNEGNPTGFSVELLNTALHVMNRHPQYTVDSWNTVKQALTVGSIQALPLVGKTPEREADYDFTFPYMTMHGTIVVRENTLMPESYEELKGKLVGVMRDDNAEEYVRRKTIPANIVTTDTFEQALRFLDEGAIDAVIIQRYLALQLINSLKLEKLKVSDIVLQDFKQDFCFAVKEGDKDLLRILNEGLSIVIANGTFDRLQAKWFSPDGSFRKRYDRLIIGGDRAYPPYEFIDENGEPAGYNVDLTRAIAKKMGLDIKIKLGPWNEIYRGMRNGEIDIIQGIFYSVDRDQNVSFSQAHTVINHVAVTRTDGPPIREAEDLKNLSILVMKDDIMHEFAINKGLGNNLLLAESQEEAIRRLSEGESHCALVARIPAHFWQEKHGLDNLKIGEVSLFSPEYNYGSSNDNDRLLQLFSEGLAAVKSSGEYREIYSEWLGIYEEEQKLSGEFILKILLYTTLPLLLIFLTALFWSRSLKNLVKERTEKLKETADQLQHKIGELEHTKKNLASSKENFHTILNSICDAVIATDKNSRIIQMNPVAEDLTGWLLKDALGTPINEVLHIINSQIPKNVKEQIEDVLSNGEIIELVDYSILIDKKGNEFRISYSIAPILSYSGNITGAVLVLQNVTEQVKLEEQFQQIRKVQSLGQLAGGVAHDLNNMLTPILGFSELLLNDFAIEDYRKDHVEQILYAVSKGKELVGQLLAFTRKQALHFVPINLNNTLEGFKLLLRRTIREDILIEIIHSSRNCMIVGDIIQIEQVILNLTVNAQDAMPFGGRLILRINQIELEEDYMRNYEIPVPGKYIELSISDTGTGIDDMTKKQIFEPYFSTKGTMGTGIGLSTVTEILKQHNAHIEVQSEAHKGTTFRIFFPVFIKEFNSEEKYYPVDSDLRGTETILLVEDNQQVCQLVQKILNQYGYNVLAVESPALALSTPELGRGQVDLLLSDVIMPEMNGIDLFNQALKMKNNLKVLFMSGYATDTITNQGILEKDFHFIQKPFYNKALAGKVREALGPV